VKKSLKSVLLLVLGLAVAGIVGLWIILAVVPKLINTKHLRTAADIVWLKTRLSDYRKRNGDFPEPPQWLIAAGVVDLSQAVDMSRDAWGSNYVYRYPGRHNPNDYDLFSAGPDRIPDTADDDWGKY
jgi:general secretion pathway protein G